MCRNYKFSNYIDIELMKKLGGIILLLFLLELIAVHAEPSPLLTRSSTFPCPTPLAYPAMDMYKLNLKTWKTLHIDNNIYHIITY